MGLVFGHSEGDMGELAHDGADDAHFELAGGAAAPLSFCSELPSCLVSRKCSSLERTAPDLIPLPCCGASRFHLLSWIPFLQQY